MRVVRLVGKTAVETICEDVVRVREIRASGAEALSLATGLLQRARLADPTGGLWEAADLQWWARKSRPSDEVDQVFWLDESGPVAAVVLTCWSEDRWQCDTLRVTGASGPDTSRLWETVVQQTTAHASGDIEIPLSHDETALRLKAEDCGLALDDEYGNGWMDIDDRPPVVTPPAGFAVQDRSHRDDAPHPMSARNGADVEERLKACSLYDPRLDLVVEANDGQPVGYALVWLDTFTGVGLVEPVRVEVEFARRGLARAMLTAGLERLARLGASRAKIGFGEEITERLYRDLGFVVGPHDAWYEGRVDQLRQTDEPAPP